MEAPTNAIYWWENTTELNLSDNLFPRKIILHSNYPNPFNPSTTVRFELPKVTNVTLTVYSIIGQTIKTHSLNNKSMGSHSIIWDAKNDFGNRVPAGMYFYELKTKDIVLTRKMTLLK